MKLIECPRDAIQGIEHFIPTAAKVKYLNQLLKVGFDTIDAGSFVSAKAIPQMADTAEVFEQLEISESKTKLLVIVANERGASEACNFKQVTCLGYPFSISETFQMMNTNATISGSLTRVKAIQELCVKHSKQLVIYISMAFGNPYGDAWNSDIVLEWTEKLRQLGISQFSLADTVGIADPENIAYLFGHLIKNYPDLEFGAHFHTIPDRWREKVEAAWDNGCRRFDGALLGYGGCPMAGNKLVGNMPTDKLVEFMTEKNIPVGFDRDLIKKLELSFQQLIAS
jgi:hydroxymethylglutaryl-CoA lyase